MTPAGAPATGPGAGAALPPRLPGLDPRWSRLVRASDADGTVRTWHVLDNAPDLAGRTPVGTLLCVHGNPTWSYLWRDLLARAGAAAAPWRVVAVDQLDMGFSERTGTHRPLARRVNDLASLVDALDLPDPVVTVGHDWGGVVSLGWAVGHRDRLGGVVLTNTAVHQPDGAAAPALIRLARTPGLLPGVTVATPAFLRVALGLAHPRLPRQVREAYRAPYRDARRRAGIGGFVADIPLAPDHPSRTELDRIAGGLERLRDVPVLLLWGPRDPVFQERHLRDLRTRLPHADLHRFEGAGHLLPQDADVAAVTLTWLRDRLGPPSPAAQTPPQAATSGTQPRPTTVDRPGPQHTTADGPGPRLHITNPAREPVPGLAGTGTAGPGAGGGARPLWAALDERAGDPRPALVELATPGIGGPRSVSWALLHRRTTAIAAGLRADGVRPGDRVALLVSPGANLTAALYACLRIGAVIVVVDAGLGAANLRRALRSADPAHVIAVGRGLAAAAALGCPGRRIAAGPVDPLTRRLLGARTSLAELARAGDGQPLPPPPPPDAEAAVLFTSGSTGPAKGVVYTHRQLAGVRDLLAQAYRVTPDDRLVAAFAPFALFGPALGVTSAVPDADVTRPGTLTAPALADAAAAADATMVFASPAALANVVATADRLGPDGRTALSRVRLLLSAGAPVPEPLLRQVAALMPAADVHTPYGMTEALPVTDITLDELARAGTGDGVCVGRPLPGVRVRISPLDAHGRASGALTAAAGCTGEVAVRAGHVKDRYDRLWATERSSSRDPGWHRTGDVGHLDDDGRLWIEGRLSHVLTTVDGARTPVGVEQRVERLPQVRRAALVGVGPAGRQQAVVVVQTTPAVRRPGPAPLELLAAVRAAAGIELAAVLVVPVVPTDVRHNSKVDRTRLARWAGRVLAGGRAGTP